MDDKTREQMITMIRSEGYISVHDLSRGLYVSPPTVRRYLTALEKEGLIRRTHGGASYIENGPNIWPLSMRSKVSLREKEYIGRAAASLIREGDHIFIDTGSTAYCLAKALDPNMKLTIATNSLPVAMLLSQQPTKTIECPGGFYDATDSAFFGEETTAFIGRRNAKFFFVSTGSMSSSGASGFDSRGMPAKHAFSRQAEYTVLMMDHSKAEKTSYYTVFEWSGIDILVTDTPPCPSIKEACERHQVRIIC